MYCACCFWWGVFLAQNNFFVLSVSLDDALCVTLRCGVGQSVFSVRLKVQKGFILHFLLILTIFS